MEEQLSPFFTTIDARHDAERVMAQFRPLEDLKTLSDEELFRVWRGNQECSCNDEKTTCGKCLFVAVDQLACGTAGHKINTLIQNCITQADLGCAFLLREFSAAVDGKGRTALHMLARQANIDGSILLPESIPQWVRVFASAQGSKDKKSMTALSYAAMHGNSTMVKELLKLPQERESVDELGHTALMCTICSPHLADNEARMMEVVQLLADPSANQLRKQTQTGKTALMAAAINGLPSVVPLLVSEAGMQDEVGKTALMYAAERGDIAIIEQLLPKEAGLRLKNGATALILAAQHGALDAVRSLALEELGISRHDGVNVLMTAAGCGWIETVEWLVGADLFIHQREGKHVLLRMQAEDGVTALMLAAGSGYQGIVSLLAPFEAGLQDKHENMTALMLAARYGSMGRQHASLLLEAEAGLQDRRGMTALMWAAQRGDVALIELLASAEAGVQRSDEASALHLAAVGGCVLKDLPTVLFEKEAHLRDFKGWTPLMASVASGQMCSLEELLTNSSVRDTILFKDGRGFTALLMAAHKGDVEMLKILHGVGAPETCTDSGETALILAAANGHEQAVAWLLGNKFSVGASNEEGVTALRAALYEGHCECVNLLMKIPAERNLLTLNEIELAAKLLSRV